MNRKREAIFMGIGVLAGLALSGPAAQAATTITATLSSQPIYVDGQRVSMTAYNIGGNNYVRLRDIGKAVDFGVTYDAATNSVHIDSNAHYQEEVTISAQIPVSPSAGLTEESVQATLWKLMEQYPNGTPYGAPYRSASNGPYSGGMNCAGWATLCSDAAFGNLPWQRITDPRWEDIQAGNLIRFDTSSSSHVVVVLDKTDEYILTTESGTHNKALWADNTSAGGWSGNPAISATPDTRSRHPQT